MVFALLEEQNETRKCIYQKIKEKLLSRYRNCNLNMNNYVGGELKKKKKEKRLWEEKKVSPIAKLLEGLLLKSSKSWKEYSDQNTLEKRLYELVMSMEHHVIGSESESEEEESEQKSEEEEEEEEEFVATLTPKEVLTLNKDITEMKDYQYKSVFDLIFKYDGILPSDHNKDTINISALTTRCQRKLFDYFHLTQEEELTLREDIEKRDINDLDFYDTIEEFNDGVIPINQEEVIIDELSSKCKIQLYYFFHPELFESESEEEYISDEEDIFEEDDVCDEMECDEMECDERECDEEEDALSRRQKRALLGYMQDMNEKQSEDVIDIIENVHGSLIPTNEDDDYIIKINSLAVQCQKDLFNYFHTNLS